MEVDLQQNNQELNEEDDEYSLKHAITQKKRSYRLEIRKKKLQQTFDKTRKTNFQEASNFNEYGNNQLNNMQGNQQEYNNGQSNQQQNEMIETLYEQNKQQLQVLQQEIDFKLEYERIVFLINELNQYIYNFDPANMTQLGNTLQSILNQYLIKETPPEIMNILKQLFLHFSLHIVIKNPQVDLAIKNTAIWCLINICSWQNDQHEVIRKLIDQDIISTLKAILKEKKYSMLYENSTQPLIQAESSISFLNTRYLFRDKGSIKFDILTIWLALNICIDNIQYRIKFSEEEFLFYLGNCVQQISENFQQKRTEIDLNLIKVILNLYTCMLTIHDKIDDQQFRVIARILNLCLDINKPEYFSLITSGIISLLIEDNHISESKFNILYECRFFSSYFLQCIQTDDDMISVSTLYKQLSLLDQKYIMLLLKQDLIFPMYILMSHPLSAVRENIAFCLSNMFMNGEKFIQIANQYMLDTKILSQIEEESLEVQKEAIWALSTLLQNQNDSQKEEFLSNKEVIRIMCEFLNKKYQQIPEQILTKLLDCFIYILDFGEFLTQEDDCYEQNPFWISIDRYQSIPILEKIALESSQENQQRAAKILDQYSWINQQNQNIFS